MAEASLTRRARAAAFETWMRNAAAAGGRVEPERPEQELLAEHHMMGLAISAMEGEARQLLRGASLRPDFWQLAVDFIGNFTHRVHRVKEEEVFFPALSERGLLTPEYCRHFAEDHEALGGLTLELCDGVAEGDWEKAFRVVSIYLSRIRPHLEMEERSLLAAEVSEIPEPVVADIQRRFHEIEVVGLGTEGRSRVVSITQELRRAVGLAELHTVIDAW